MFANIQPSASNFKCFSQSVEQFFLTVGQSNFGNKIPFFSFNFYRKMMVFKNEIECFDHQKLVSLGYKKTSKKTLLELLIKDNFW